MDKIRFPSIFSLFFLPWLASQALFLGLAGRLSDTKREKRAKSEEEEEGRKAVLQLAGLEKLLSAVSGGVSLVCGLWRAFGF